MVWKIAAYVAAFAATIPAANWLIGNVGVTCVPDGPCLVPVGFGLMAPSGVLMIGLALVLRDLVHEAAGLRGSLIAIAIGGALSWLLAPAPLAVASVAAFVLAELADTFVYAPLRQRNKPAAVLASGAVGAVVDSAVFLYLAFGSLTYIEGNVVGKLWMSGLVAVLFFANNRCWLGHAWRGKPGHDDGWTYVNICERCGKEQSGWIYRP
jgi:queuosine precursor transporter